MFTGVRDVMHAISIPCIMYTTASVLEWFESMISDPVTSQARVQSTVDVLVV